MAEITPNYVTASESLYHVWCDYHGEVGAAAAEADAEALAGEHLAAQHSDPNGNIAPGAAVEVTAVSHISASQGSSWPTAGKAAKETE